MYSLKPVPHVRSETRHTLFTHHADFCCYEIAESIEPFHIGLEVTGLLLLTETSLGRKKAEEGIEPVSHLTNTALRYLVATALTCALKNWALKKSGVGGQD